MTLSFLNPSNLTDLKIFLLNSLSFYTFAPMTHIQNNLTPLTRICTQLVWAGYAKAQTSSLRADLVKGDFFCL